MSTEKKSIGPKVAENLKRLSEATLEKGSALSNEEIRLVTGVTSRPAVGAYKKRMAERNADLLSGKITPDESSADALVPITSTPAPEPFPMLPEDTKSPAEAKTSVKAPESLSPASETIYVLVDEKGFETTLEVSGSFKGGILLREKPKDTIIQINYKGNTVNINKTKLDALADSDVYNIPGFKDLVSVAKLRILVELS